MPFPNEHALRLKSPGLFDPDSFRRTNGGKLFGGSLTVPSTIGIIWAKLKGQSSPSDPPILQALRFKKSQWTVASAKAWISKNMKAKGRFEPAQSTSAAGEASAAITPQELEAEVMIGDMEEYVAGEALDFDSLEADLDWLHMDEAHESDAVAEAAAQMMQLMGEESLIEEESIQDDAVADSAQFAEKVDKEAETQTVEDVEIFAVGNHNGMAYSQSDLDEIVKNFSSLSKWIKPPLKAGHGPQGFLRAAGLPAAGWISSIKRKGDKLLATITDIPRRLAEIIRKKGYKRVSVEIYGNYQDPQGKRHGLALAALALLGGDIPAVKTLKDWEMLYTDRLAMYDENEGHNEDIRRLVYMAAEEKKDETSVEEPQEDDTETSAIDDEEEEEEENEETSTSEDTDKPKVETKPTIPAEYAERVTKLERKLETAMGIIETQTAQMAEQTQRAVSAEIDSFITTHVEAGRFPPALTEKAHSLLMGLHKHQEDVLTYTQGDGDDAIEVSTDPFSLAKDLIAGLPDRVQMAEIARTKPAPAPGADEEARDTEERTEYQHRDNLPVHGVTLVDAVEKYMEENPESSYPEALSAVSKRDKKI